MTPQQGAQEIRKRARALKEELRKAEKETLRRGVERAKILSSGEYSLRQLARMGHPYGRGRRRNQPVHTLLKGRKGYAIGPGADPAVINAQTGAFRRGWRRMLGSWAGGSMTSLIYNVDAKAKWLHRGTRYMIARPIRKRLIDKYIEPDRTNRLREALRRALKI